jgi:hypothetical protein
VADLGEDAGGARVVDAAGGLDQRGVGRRGGGDEPRVDRDAVAADAGAGAEDLHARVAVGQADHLPYVEAEARAHVGELVGEGDVDVAEGVLRELGQLGDLGAARWTAPRTKVS